MEARDEVQLYTGHSFKTATVPLDPVWHWYNSEYDLQREGHFFSVFEEMKTTQSKKGRNRWNNFEHYKAFRGNPPEITFTRIAHSDQNFPIGGYSAGWLKGYRALCYGYNTPFTRYVGPFGEPGLPLQGLPSYVVMQANGDFLPVPGDLSSLEAAAMRTMLPAVKQRLSLVNSIIELKDFKSLAATTARAGLLSIARGLTLRQKFRRAYRSVRGLLRSKPADATSAGLYLQVQFNILPLISDVMAVRKAIADVEEQVRKLVNRAGVPQTMHYTRHLGEDMTVDDAHPEPYVLLRQPHDLSVNNLLYQAAVMRRQAISDRPVFHAEIEYCYQFSKWQAEHAQLLGMLDALGVNLNPAIVWNAIPWSFVVDWLVGVSRWLNDRKILNLEPRMNITRYLWSYKRSRRVYPAVDIWRNYVPSDQLPALSESLYPKDIKMPVVFETSYKRWTGWPAPSSLETSGVNLTEFTLGSALVIARRRRPKRRA